MAEYIERENAYKLISEQKEKETGMYSKGRNIGLNIAKSIIHSKEQCPTADVVKVVRCKDCKHAKLDLMEKGLVVCRRPVLKNGQLSPFNWENKYNDFCSYGELKELEK